MLRGLWNRLVGRRHEAIVEHEAERKQMSTEERRVTGESVDDVQAEGFVREHLGGIDPDRLLGQDERPRD